MSKVRKPVGKTQSRNTRRYKTIEKHAVPVLYLASRHRPSVVVRNTYSHLAWKDAGDFFAFTRRHISSRVQEVRQHALQRKQGVQQSALVRLKQISDLSQLVRQIVFLKIPKRTALTAVAMVIVCGFFGLGIGLQHNVTHSDVVAAGAGTPPKKVAQLAQQGLSSTNYKTVEKR